MSDLILGVLFIALGIFMRTSKFKRYTDEATDEDDFTTGDRMIKGAAGKSICLIIFGVVFLLIGYLRVS